MTVRQPYRTIKTIVLGIAVVVLGFALVRVGLEIRRSFQTSDTGSGQPGETTTSPPPVVSPESALPAQIQFTSTPFLPEDIDPSAPTSPADEWANRVLDQVLPVLEQPLPPGESLAWWQAGSARGILSHASGRIKIDQRNLAIDGFASTGVFVPDLLNPGQLYQLAEISWKDAALELSVSPEENRFVEDSWLLSSVDPSLAVQALIIQAEQRGLILIAAFTETPEGDGQLVLINAVPEGTAGSATLTAQPTSLAPSPGPVTTQAVTPEPTREFDPYLGTVLDEKMAVFIATWESFHPDAVTRFRDHPWAGLLTWTESGPQINGQPVSVRLAEKLNLYTLLPDDATGRVLNLAEFAYASGRTRLVEDSLIFFGDRMEEVLFWLVRYAAEQEGQFFVTYDDLGSKQSITLVEFIPYPSDTPTPSPTP